MERFCFRIFMCIAIVCMGVLGTAARNNTYPFRTNLTVNPTGAGTVYATYNGNATPTTTNQSSYDGEIDSWYDDVRTATVSLNATAATGYRFVSWTDSNTGEVISRTSSVPVSQVYDTNNASYSDQRVLFFFVLRTYSPRQQFSYTANFALQGNVIAKVNDGQENIGSADIQEDSFVPGQEITLLASNINGSEFNGWAFDHWELNGEEVSTSKTLKVTVPENETTLVYVAHFRQADTEYYCFIRNKATGRYLKLSDTKNYTKPTNNSNPVGSFNGSFTLLDESKAIADPACVFIVSGTSDAGGLKKASIKSQDVSVGYLQGSQIIYDHDYGLTIKPSSAGAYYISANYKISQGGQSQNTPIYFRDNNGTPDIAGTLSTTSEWEILELSRVTLASQYFGAAPNALLTRDGKYYTTLYTTFPFELQSGKAYYVGEGSVIADETGVKKVICKDVPEGKVPAYFPVIIECDGTTPDMNKILPLPKDTEIDKPTNYSLGHIDIYNGVKQGDGNMYILSTGSAGLGMYKLKTGTTMTNNKAYAYLDQEQQAAVTGASFYIKDEGQASEVIELVIPDEKNAPVYDLQGRKVNSPKRGIYIINGKKQVFK